MTIDWREVLDTEVKEKRRTVRKLPCGVSVYRQNRSLIVIPPSKGWRSLSSGNFNGGYLSSPSAVFNTTSLGGQAEYSMMGEPKEVLTEYYCKCAEIIDLNPSSTVGLGTAAHMDNAAIGTVILEGTEISAIITGGIRGNGGRAGDPASYDEMERNMNKNGTIVIILVVDADLSDSALLGSMMTATEAKSRVIQRLMAKSLYSTSIATGSGTDQVAVICNKDSPVKIDKYRNMSEIGRMIKSCVEKTLSDALDKQSMMNLQTQCNPYTMISRYRITEMNCHSEIRYPFEMHTLREGVEYLSRNPKVAAAVSAILHVMDEVEWGMISPDTGNTVCRSLISATLLGPAANEPVLKKRFEKTDTAIEMLKLAMAMKLIDVSQKIESDNNEVRP